MSQLLQTIGNIPADELTPEHLRRYFVYCFEKLNLTENTLHSRINALKFYYEQVLGREKFFWEIPRPKKQLQLPRFFNQNEITSIIKAAGNLKHKTMLMLAYAAGLRVSEVVSIRTKDIDSSRMCILIRQAKGKKDRMVALSPVLLVMLREYWMTEKPSRDGYLFPGQYKGEPYSTRSLQLVLAAAKKKAGVLKPGSIHALRHSFATHLLDKGTDVTMIMKLMGHNDIRTTLRYLHSTNRDLLQIISPLDDLDLS
jgi:site-specific recombinase XerD